MPLKWVAGSTLAGGGLIYSPLYKNTNTHPQQPAGGSRVSTHGALESTPRGGARRRRRETHALRAPDVSLFRSVLCAWCRGPVLALHCGLRAILQRACALAGTNEGWRVGPFVRTQFGEWWRFEQQLRAGWPTRVQHTCSTIAIKGAIAAPSPFQPSAVARSEHELARSEAHVVPLLYSNTGPVLVPSCCSPRMPVPSAL